MKKFRIEDVKVGISAGGLAHSPDTGSVIAEVCLRNLEDGTVKYYSLSELEGSPTFFETNISTYDAQIAEIADDEEFRMMLSEHIVGGYYDYNEFFDTMEETELQDKERALIWKFLVYMVRADWDEVEQMKKESIGQILSEVEIPVSDVEQEYLDEKN